MGVKTERGGGGGGLREEEMGRRAAVLVVVMEGRFRKWRMEMREEAEEEKKNGEWRTELSIDEWKGEGEGETEADQCVLCVREK